MTSRANLCLAFVGLSLLAGCGDERRDRRREDDDAEGREPAATTGPAAERAALQRVLQEEAKDVHSGYTGGAYVSVEPQFARSAAPGDAMDFGMIGLLNSGVGAPPGSEGFAGSTGAAKPPSVRMGATSVSGRLPPEVIQRIVRQNFGRFRLCYENGLRTNPNLRGRVSVGFTIGRDGSVGSVGGEGDMDAGVIGCVTKAFYSLKFPHPEGGVVKVKYPILFEPGDAKKPTLNGKPIGSVTADDVKAALEKAGCTDIEKKEPPTTSSATAIFVAKKDGKTVTVTFFSTSGGKTIGAAELTALKAVGEVYDDQQVALAIQVEGDADKSKAKTLLDKIVVR